jgi:hypothetical protein
MQTVTEQDVAVIEYRDEDHGTGLVFQWHGGAYIEVGYYNGTEDALPVFHAEDVINVWDDEADASYFETREPMPTPSIRRPFRYILEAFEDRCREYLEQELTDDES